MMRRDRVPELLPICTECGAPTNLIGTKLCNSCWEMKRSGKYDKLKGQHEVLKEDNEELRNLLRELTARARQSIDVGIIGGSFGEEFLFTRIERALARSAAR